MLSRLKFEIEGLFQEIYDERLPETLFMSETTTFADLQSAGLQSIIPLVNKLRKYGHSDENIRSRVFAFMENDLYLNYVQVKNSDLPVTFDIYKESIDMKFDVVIGNPPYQKNDTATGNNIYQKIVEKSVEISNHYVVMIHPSSWRMPLRKNDTFYGISRLIKKYSEYVRILTQQESKEIFGLALKLDYYVLNKKKSNKNTLLENKSETISIDISNLDFIPHNNFNLMNVFTKKDDDKIEVVYSYKYDPRNVYVSETQDDEFIYPLVHSTPTNGNRFKYSSLNTKGHFGIPKVIFGESGINDVIIDMDGEYGMTQGAIGIKVSSLEEANNFKTALLSDNFKVFIESYIWSNFRVDWRLFTYLKKDFWKEFINE